MQINVFIDYDNLTVLQKRAGLLDVITKALLASPLKTHSAMGHCDVRVYGGWYEGSSLTPLAQRIAAELQADFPTLLRCLTVHNTVCALSTQAELAWALVEEPTHHLLDTYRKKRFPYNLRFTDPAGLGCRATHCPLSSLPLLFNTECCPEASCAITLGDILHRAEQKLVDTMLTCDMIHTANQPGDLVIVISDDDDLLPAIRTVSLRGTPVLRIHPKPFTKLAVFPPGGAALMELSI